jgi:PAS domain S-box-containing protein
VDEKQRLLEQEEEIKDLLAAVPGGIFKYEAKRRGQFTFVSAQLLRLLGYTEAEFRKKFNNCFDDMVYKEDREKVLQSIDDQIQNGEFDTCEYRIETKSGFLRWFYDVGHQVTDENGKKWFYVVVVDIDDRKRLREEREIKKQLEAQLLAAREANRAKSLFLSDVSHDMRTPLNGIIGFTELALGEGDAARKQEYLRKIKSSSQALLNLVQDTLDLSKIEAGTYALRPAPVSCNEIVEAITTAIMPMAEAKQITFTVENSKAVLADINTDAARVQEIILNLLTNAVKFTPRGGHVELIIECLKATPEYIYDKISVRDNGRGISPEFLPHVFEAFSQEREWDEENTTGSGLGLSIVKKLVELLKGRIEVTSTPGKGSTFTLYLDFARVGNYQKKAERSAPVAGNLPGKRILVCEDNAINAEIVTKLLEHQKMQVVHAKNGKEGLEVFQASEPGYFNAILMDVRMPVLDGIAASQAIRRLSRQDAEMVPIIALSANAYQEDIEKALAAGINDYIVKPVVPGLLYHVLSSWIKQ